MILLPATLALTALAAGPSLSVTVEGTTTCPTPADVTARLQALLPRLDPWDAVDRVQLHDDGAVLRVTLVDAKGTPLGQRLLPASASCAALADAAALVIAAWKSDVHAEFAADLPDVNPPRAPAAQVTTSSASKTGPPARAGGRAPDFELLVGGGLSLAGPGSGAPAAAAAWGAPSPVAVVRTIFAPSLAPRGLPVAGALFASLETERTFDLGAGHVAWQRWAAGAGLELQLAAGWARLTARVDLALARVPVAGTGYAQSLAAVGWTPGALAGLRLALPAGGSGWAAAAWCDLGAAHWWRAQEARVEASTGATSARLPALTLMTTIGVSLGHVR